MFWVSTFDLLTQHDQVLGLEVDTHSLTQRDPGLGLGSGSGSRSGLETHSPSMSMSRVRVRARLSNHSPSMIRSASKP